MSLLDDFTAVDFSELTPSGIEEMVITAYEEASGQTVYPGDPVRLFLQSNAYIISLLAAFINETGNQQYLAHARGPHQDLIGALVDTARLPASPSRTVLRFSTAETLGWPVLIPQGTRANAGDGDTGLTFATDETATIPAGERSVDVDAVRNTETTRLGADVEDDASYRARIRLAPERFSVAGPSGSYRYHALSAHQGIADVAVYAPVPGTVDVRPVMDGGELPPENVLELVRERLSADGVRPLTDTVVVAAPEPVEYAVSGGWWLHRDNGPLAASVTKKVEAALEEYRIWQRSAPGRDINPTRLISLLERAGAKRVELESPRYQKLEQRQIARETSLDLQFMGIEDD